MDTRYVGVNETVKKADPPLRVLVERAENKAKHLFSKAKVFFDEKFHTIERRTPGPVFNRPVNDPDGIFNKTSDIDSAVATLRLTTTVGYPFETKVGGYNITGHMDLPAALSLSRVNPKISFDHPSVSC